MGSPVRETRLAELGWDEGFARAFDEHAARGLVPARVAVQHRGGLDLLTGDEELLGVPAGTLDGLPAVGDWTAVEPLPGEAKAVVRAVLPRRTAFTRTDPWTSEEEVVAANVDVVLIVTAVGRDFNPRRLERYLAAARASGAEPVVLVNKADLDPEGARTAAAEAERVAFGAPVHAASAKRGDAVEVVRRHLAPGRTVAFLGSSGVGKSTLVNRLLGGQVQATGEVRADERGRHTTTRRELMLLPGGGLLLDTPGLRELQLGRVDLEDAFPDVADLAERCRFRDCDHVHEPGCAVRAAVEDGSLPRARYDSYLKLREELRGAEKERVRRRRRRGT